MPLRVEETREGRDKERVRERERERDVEWSGKGGRRMMGGRTREGMLLSHFCILQVHVLTSCTLLSRFVMASNRR